MRIECMCVRVCVKVCVCLMRGSLDARSTAAPHSAGVSLGMDELNGKLEDLGCVAQLGARLPINTPLLVPQTPLPQLLLRSESRFGLTLSEADVAADASFGRACALVADKVRRASPIAPERSLSYHSSVREVGGPPRHRPAPVAHAPNPLLVVSRSCGRAGRPSPILALARPPRRRTPVPPRGSTTPCARVRDSRGGVARTVAQEASHERSRQPDDGFAPWLAQASRSRPRDRARARSCWISSSLSCSRRASSFRRRRRLRRPPRPPRRPPPPRPSRPRRRRRRRRSSRCPCRRRPRARPRGRPW